MYFDCTMVFRTCKSAPTANELGHADANSTQAIYAHQIARAHAEAGGVRAGVLIMLRVA